MTLVQTDHDAAIRAVVAETERRQSDADQFAELLTADAVLVNAVGRRVLGREAVRAALAAALQTPLANVLTRNEIVDIRLLRPDVALVSGIKRVLSAGSEHAEPGAKIHFSFVLVNDADTWRIAVAHNTLVANDTTARSGTDLTSVTPTLRLQTRHGPVY
jgi:uncharacterized protein (TIGR02246 family)